MPLPLSPPLAASTLPPLPTAVTSTSLLLASPSTPPALIVALLGNDALAVLVTLFKAIAAATPSLPPLEEVCWSVARPCRHWGPRR